MNSKNPLLLDSVTFNNIKLQKINEIDFIEFCYPGTYNIQIQITFGDIPVSNVNIQSHYYVEDDLLPTQSFSQTNVWVPYGTYLANFIYSTFSHKTKICFDYETFFVNNNNDSNNSNSSKNNDLKKLDIWRGKNNAYPTMNRFVVSQIG